VKEDYDSGGGGGEDPKDLIEYHVSSMQAGYFMYEGKYALAESQELGHNSN